MMDAERILDHDMGPGAIRQRVRQIAAVSLSLVLTFSVGVTAQVVEEFVLATDEHNALGENPEIAGNRVVWLRTGRPGELPRDRFQCRDLRFADNPVVNLVGHPAGFGGDLLTPERFFRGGISEFPYLSSWLVGSDCELGAERRLSDMNYTPVASNDKYLFVRIADSSVPPFVARLLAMRLEDLESDDEPSFVEIMRLHSWAFISRTEAASERYFVWQDRPLGEERRIYAIDLSNGLAAKPRQVVRARLSPRHANRGSYLALHGSYLVYQGVFDVSEEFPWGLFFVDLSKDEEPRPIALIEDDGVSVHRHVWPAVSNEFIVWTEVIEFFERQGWAMRIVDGQPSGDAFHIASGVSWPEIERNIVVYNGSTINAAGQTVSAVRALELDLPGATDVGDADSNGRLNVSDAVVVLRYLFAGGPRPRLRLADSDFDRALTASDAIGILRMLFPSGPRP